MKLSIPTGIFAGYIFDCDGTIADTMPLHYRAWTQTVESHGGKFPEDLFYDWGGTPSHIIVEKLNEKFALSMDPVGTARQKELCYKEFLSDVRPIQTVLEIARELSKTAPLAIASGGYREFVEPTLEAIGAHHLFKVVVCAEDYAKGKPAPDAFLEAASRLKVSPESCLVFEDSILGIEAAKSAGMQYVFVPSARKSTP